MVAADDRRSIVAQPSDAHAALVLSRCRDAGVVVSWERRPLGIYRVHEWDGDMYTFDRKEATLWGQGALSGLGFAVMLQTAGLPKPAPPVVPAAPGWYPDPGGSAGVRWFNGQTWTNDLRPSPPGPPASTRAVPDSESPARRSPSRRTYTVRLDGGTLTFQRLSGRRVRITSRGLGANPPAEVIARAKRAVAREQVRRGEAPWFQGRRRA